MTTTGKRRRYPTGDSANESDDDNREILNENPQLISKRRVSATADLAAHRLIVSERRQLAVLKQLTATDETSRIKFEIFFSKIFIFVYKRCFTIIIFDKSTTTSNENFST
jgi:hypothetical protein